MKKLLLALALCLMAIPVHGNDFSKSVDKDLASQCWKVMDYISSEKYGIKIKRPFRYYPAVRISEKHSNGEILNAQIEIEFNDSSNEELFTWCSFNSKREVATFGDPWDLLSTDDRVMTSEFHTPYRFD